ncbi:teichoic acid transporter [Pseudoscardovia radai]|uniref:Teichoic acid transporter n=1 Tax=Pseudoscardovia radai TaxID=987066 RepID=A0A261F0A6_9BIFI|nr:teichoic acid transporter [Pseudoscardovia radai]OZG52493.1 teichoic acid transporter [Pseudoscardovia radai]
MAETTTTPVTAGSTDCSAGSAEGSASRTEGSAARAQATATTASSEVSASSEASGTSEPAPLHAAARSAGESATLRAENVMSDAELESRMSYADIKRRHTRPKSWLLFLVCLLAAIMVPYGIGRWLAFHRTAQITQVLAGIEPRGIALVSWGVTVFCFVFLLMAFMENMALRWTALFLVMLAGEQFIGGMCLLRARFWYSTYVVYGTEAGVANGANVGVLAAGVGLAVFALLYVLVLVLVDKRSPLNVLTKDWAALLTFLVIETIAYVAAVAWILPMFA